MGNSALQICKATGAVRGVSKFVNRADGEPFTEAGADVVEAMAMMAVIALRRIPRFELVGINRF